MATTHKAPSKVVPNNNPPSTGQEEEEGRSEHQPASTKKRQAENEERGSKKKKRGEASTTQAQLEVLVETASNVEATTSNTATTGKRTPHSNIPPAAHEFAPCCKQAHHMS